MKLAALTARVYTSSPFPYTSFRVCMSRRPHLCTSFYNEVHIYCKVADFYHVTFTFRRADFYYEIPSIGSQEENPHLSVQGHSYYCIICLFFFCYSFSCERNLCGEHKARRRTAFQLATIPSALSVRRLIVGRFAIATMQPPTLAEDRRLQLGLFADATYYCYLP